MPKYRATLVRVEKYVEEIEFESLDETNALHYALCRLGDGIEFDGEVVEGNEYVDIVEEIKDETT